MREERANQAWSIEDGPKRLIEGDSIITFFLIVVSISQGGAKCSQSAFPGISRPTFGGTVDDLELLFCHILFLLPFLEERFPVVASLDPPIGPTPRPAQIGEDRNRPMHQLGGFAKGHGHGRLFEQLSRTPLFDFEHVLHSRPNNFGAPYVVKALDVKALRVIVCIVYVEPGLPSTRQVKTKGHHRTAGLVAFLHCA